MTEPPPALHDFASEWIRALQAVEPMAIVGRSDDPLALTVDFSDGVRVSTLLHACWAARNTRPTSKLIADNIRDLLDFRAPQTDSAVLRACLRPHVLTQEAIQTLAPHGLGDWPIAGRLQVMLVLEANGRQRPVLAEERIHLGDRPLRVAIANLIEAVGHPSYGEIGGGVWRVLLDEVHESGLLLLSGLWNALEEQLGGTVIVAHPSPSVLLCACESDPSALTALADAATESVDPALRESHVPSLLRWRGTSWETVVPERRCGVCSWSTASTDVRCPSCGTPLDEDRFLAWLVGSAVLGVLWMMLASRLGIPLTRPWLLEATISGIALGTLGYGVSLFRAQSAEPWRPVLRDTEANLLDRTVRVPMVLALALGWAALPQIVPQIVQWPEHARPAIATALVLRDTLVVGLIAALPLVLIARHGARWLDPRPINTLDQRAPPAAR